MCCIFSSKKNMCCILILIPPYLFCCLLFIWSQNSLFQTDKVSMLDEAIDYLKSLQLQLQVLNDIISYAQVGYTWHIYFSYLPLSCMEWNISKDLAIDRGAWRLAINVPEPWPLFVLCPLCPFTCLPVSRLFWVSSLAYPNLFGTKDYVVVVVVVVSSLLHSFLFYLFSL
jgi:hypothetical protein